jgi:hypothetical protein
VAAQDAAGVEIHMQAEHDRRVDYLEIPVPDVAAARRFYGAAFGWTFYDYGPDYQSFHDGRLGGGFCTGPLAPAGGALLVIYSRDLGAAEAAVVAAGGTIVRPTYAFPGGRRFHFTDPNGYEMAVWSE